MELLLTLLLNGLVVFGVARTVPGIRLDGYGTGLWVAAVYGILSLLLKGVLVALTFPLVALSFGLFLFVLNGFLLWLTDKILVRFEIERLSSLALATVGITAGFVLVDWVVAVLL
jgi:putative membrane protein